MIKKVVLISFVVVFALALVGCGEKTTKTVNDKVGQATTTLSKNLAIAEARVVYKVKKGMDTDMSSGPCLSNDLIDDWVFDIAHDPRQEIDNLPENQCAAYREGKAHHFVEFDPEGNLIRAE